MESVIEWTTTLFVKKPLQHLAFYCGKKNKLYNNAHFSSDVVQKTVSETIKIHLKFTYRPRRGASLRKWLIHTVFLTSESHCTEYGIFSQSNAFQLFAINMHDYCFI